MENEKRNSGIELLRIVSMFMILVLHYCSKGGFISEQVFKSQLSEVSWFVRAFSIVAVNCFVLITGYFSVKSKCSYKKVLKIWGQTFFYSVTAFIIFKFCLNTNLNLKESLTYFFPIMLKTYWFISIYIILYLLAPYLNACLNTIDKKTFKRLLIILLIITCLSSILSGFYTTIDESNGYGILWFVALYCIAGYIRLYGKEKYNKLSCLLKYIFISLIIYFSRIILWKICEKGILSSSTSCDIFYRYNSITVALSSIYLFLFFKNINIKILKNIVLKVAPLTLAVYIIHETPLVRNILYTNILHTNLVNNIKKFILALPIACFAIFIVCCGIETVRIRIFKILSYINNKYLIQVKERIIKVFNKKY